MLSPYQRQFALPSHIESASVAKVHLIHSLLMSPLTYIPVFLPLQVFVFFSACPDKTVSIRLLLLCPYCIPIFIQFISRSRSLFFTLY